MKITEVTFEPFMVREEHQKEIASSIADADNLFKLILDKTETCFIKKENRELVCMNFKSYPICTFFVDERFEEKEIIRLRTQL